MTEQSTDQYMRLPDGYMVRPVARTDAQGVADLINATDVAAGAPAETTAAEVAENWDEDGFDMECGACVIENAEGMIVGYEETQDEQHDGQLWLDGYVHPAHMGRGLGTFLLQQGQHRAYELAAKFADDVQVKMVVNCYSHDESAIEIFKAEGFQTERHYWRMETDLNEAPAATVPEGIAIRTFVTGQDDRATHAAVTEAFLDHWGSTPLTFEEWATRIGGEGFDPMLWFLAVDQASGEIAGFSLCKVRGETSAWVNTLGVRRPWRKRGLGMALLQHSFAEFYRRGFRTVGLGVDTESLTGATRLYERAGMRVAHRYDRFVKVIREGVGTH